ncbi:hypothetical protein WN944_005026 [Citrus x changshan-huyou]|uniref:Uncharacterized protein n=1 Tax=Citrus x changshan-huyou TaxID=2935761 RepID=A0AAP0QGU2_9ROSI
MHDKTYVEHSSIEIPFTRFFGARVLAILPIWRIVKLTALAFGLGFDQKSNDFKIVRILYAGFFDGKPAEVEVYSLSGERQFVDDDWSYRRTLCA